MRSKAALKYTGKIALRGFLIFFFIMGIVYYLPTVIISEITEGKEGLTFIGIEIFLSFSLMGIGKDLFFDGVKFINNFNLSNKIYFKAIIITITIAIIIVTVLSGLFIYSLDSYTLLEVIYYDYKSVFIGGNIGNLALQKLPIIINLFWIFIFNIVVSLLGLLFGIYTISEKTSKNAALVLGGIIMFFVFILRSNKFLSMVRIVFVPFIDNYILGLILASTIICVLLKVLKTATRKIEI